MKKRELTEEEKKMWDAVTSNAKPMRASSRKVASKPPASKPLPKTRILSPLPQGNDDDYTLARGSYANMDRNNAERLRKGEYPIDATLDLHGMTRDKAYNALSHFLRVQYERGSRCLLIITGKGVGKEQPQGVLRESLPQWLNRAELKSVVLAFDVAKPKHGGSGAFYLLLKRKRVP